MNFVIREFMTGQTDMDISLFLSAEFSFSYELGLKSVSYAMSSVCERTLIVQFSCTNYTYQYGVRYQVHGSSELCRGSYE